MPRLAVLAALFATSSPMAVAHRLAAQGGEGSEQQQQQQQQRQRHHTVHLLVTRHGLSCANIVEKWISWYDFGRGSILDPLLGGLGLHDAREAGLEAKEWLSARGHRLDAVLSSNLLRAMETALIMYPRDARPLYVVPYIREHASGASNAPKHIDEQIQDLRAVPGIGNLTHRIDHKWTDIFGHEPAEWPDFLNFLAQSFLPDLVRKQHKPPGSPIFLAVVTHSKFMAKSLKDDCSTLWTEKKATKPLNNQVLHLSYDFHARSPDPGSVDVTVSHSLVRAQEPCTEVARGAPGYGKGGGEICFSDIGSACARGIQQHALTPGTLWEKTSEMAILKLAEKVIAARVQAKAREINIEGLARAIADAGDLKSRTCEAGLFGCSPARDCQYVGYKCVTRDKVLEEQKKQFELDLASLYSEADRDLARLGDLQRAPCRAGGRPDIASYFSFLGLRISPEVWKLLSPFSRAPGGRSSQ